jgi:hypothetical protein
VTLHPAGVARVANVFERRHRQDRAANNPARRAESDDRRPLQVTPGDELDPHFASRQRLATAPPAVRLDVSGRLVAGRCAITRGEPLGSGVDACLTRPYIWS